MSRNNAHKLLFLTKPKKKHERSHELEPENAGQPIQSGCRRTLNQSIQRPEK
uniref:Uncharacterized protein n=1 Tax=Daucus carota subsp. sativus TaxID=79200 RepID=A0A164Z2Q1_DAUCS